MKSWIFSYCFESGKGGNYVPLNSMKSPISEDDPVVAAKSFNAKFPPQKSPFSDAMPDVLMGTFSDPDTHQYGIVRVRLPNFDVIK